MLFPSQIAINYNTKKFFSFLTCVIGSFSIFRQISFSVTPRFLNNIYWVFFIFSDNLFAFSHRSISVNSSFSKVCISSKFFPLRNKFVSSANSMGKLCLHTICKSLIYIRNSNCPSTEPCGTPHLIWSFLDLAPLYVTNWVLWVR